MRPGAGARGLLAALEVVPHLVRRDRLDAGKHFGGFVVLMNLFCETLSNLFVHCIAQVGHSPLDEVGMSGNFAVANAVAHWGNKGKHVVAHFNKCSRALVRVE